MSGRARGEGLPSITTAGSAPAASRGEPPLFLDLANRGTTNAGNGAISAHLPPSKWGKRAREAGRAGRNGQGRRWERPSPSQLMKVEREAGLLTPPPNPAASARSPMRRRLTTQGGSPQLGESISPSEVPPNRHPNGLGADGEPWGSGLPRLKRMPGERGGAGFENRILDPNF